MKPSVLPLLAVMAFGLPAIAGNAQDKTKTKPKPKNEISKLNKGRKTDRTTRQVTVDPKKSPGKHAKNLSKNVNHEVNRESKDVNKLFQGKKKKKK